jgi:type II secretory pathway pseudopilin PulG
MSAAVAVAFVVVVLVVGGLLAYAIFQWGRQYAIGAKTRAELITNEEYRRLSEMTITAQEHTELKLGEISMQLAQLRGQLDQVQKVLKDVE